jgi:hypothetical protein
MRDDLETFAPAPRVLTIAGDEVELWPLRLRDYARFVRAITPAMGQLMAGDLMGALVEHEDSVIEAVSVGSKIRREDLEDLGMDEIVRLGSAVIEVNADFFLRRVLPEVTAARARIEAIVSPPDGGSSSLGSAPEATPSTPA